VKTPWRVNVLLAGVTDEAENEAVHIGNRLTILAIVVIGACPLGMAQNQDRDPYKASRTSATAPPPETRIDVNHATEDELLKVPGMTRSWAGRIVRFRPYRTKQELLDKGVVSSEVYDHIKDYVIAHRDKQ
jgi:DNA uptake protein ComE-like DNA-binding protein